MEFSQKFVHFNKQIQLLEKIKLPVLLFILKLYAQINSFSHKIRKAFLQRFSCKDFQLAQLFQKTSSASKSIGKDAIFRYKFTISIGHLQQLDMASYFYGFLYLANNSQAIILELCTNLESFGFTTSKTVVDIQYKGH